LREGAPGVAIEKLEELMRFPIQQSSFLSLKRSKPGLAEMRMRDPLLLPIAPE